MRTASKCYCIQFRRAANYLTKQYDRRLQPAGLTVNQFSLLSNLDRLETANVSELAEYVGLERSTLVRTLKPLLERGWIRDAAKPGTRDRAIQLTEEGRNTLVKARTYWKEAQAEVEKELGREGIAELRRIMEKLYMDEGKAEKR